MITGFWLELSCILNTVIEVVTVLFLLFLPIRFCGLSYVRGIHI